MFYVYKSFTGLTIICKQIIVMRSPESLYQRYNDPVRPTFVYK